MTIDYEAASPKRVTADGQTGTSPERSRAATKQFRPPQNANMLLRCIL